MLYLNSAVAGSYDIFNWIKSHINYDVYLYKGDLVNQDGRVPPGVPGQPMTNFGIWLRRLLTGGEANSPYRAQTVHPHLSLTHQIPEIRQPSVPAHLGERWLLKTIPAICTSEYCNAQR